LRTVLIIESVQKLLLCSAATFKKAGYETHFNQVSLGCRYSGVNTPAQIGGGGGEEKGAQPATGILEFE
jgi:hypothetical protein